MKTKAPKPTPTRLGLYVTTERDRSYGDYFHIKASVVTIGLNAYERRRIDDTPDYRPEAGYDTIRNTDDSTDYGGLYLSNLHVTCQGQGTDTPRRLYGFAVEYRNVGSVDQRAAERMATTLKTIDKRMEALDETFGRPSGFGQYLARVAAAIKCETFVFKQGASRGWSYSDMDHQICDVSQGIYKVEGLADAWIREDEIAAQKREQEQRQADAS